VVSAAALKWRSKFPASSPKWQGSVHNPFEYDVLEPTGAQPRLRASRHERPTGPRPRQERARRRQTGDLTLRRRGRPGSCAKWRVVVPTFPTGARGRRGHESDAGSVSEATGRVCGNFRWSNRRAIARLGRWEAFWAAVELFEIWLTNV
jgi:hypothetical protein